MRTGCHYLICLCVTFVVFTDCESCTRPISTHPGSMEAEEYGLTRDKCFLAGRLELDAVAGLLWISCGVLLVGRDFSVFCCRFFFFFERTRPAASMMRTRCLIYLSTSTSGSPTDYDASTKCALGGVPGNVIRLWRLYYMLSLRCSLLWCTRCARSVW